MYVSKDSMGWMKVFGRETKQGLKQNEILDLQQILRLIKPIQNKIRVNCKIKKS